MVGFNFKTCFAKKTKPDSSVHLSEKTPQRSLSLSVDSTQLQVKEIEEIFKRFDANGDGKIDSSELGSMLTSLGHTLTEEELKRMVEEVDSDGDGFIDLKEFIQLNATDSDKHLEDIESAFAIMDANGDGLLSPHELQKVLKSLGEEASIGDCKVMIKAFDCDGDGFISFEEFKKMMKTKD